MEELRTYHSRTKRLERELAEAQDALTVRIKGECCCPGGECLHFPVDPWVARALLAERQLAEARLLYAACSNEYRRVIADLTACRTNALAAARERDALKATLEQARRET